MLFFGHKMVAFGCIESNAVHPVFDHSDRPGLANIKWFSILLKYQYNNYGHFISLSQQKPGQTLTELDQTGIGRKEFSYNSFALPPC